VIYSLLIILFQLILLLVLLVKRQLLKGQLDKLNLNLHRNRQLNSLYQDQLRVATSELRSSLLQQLTLVRETHAASQEEQRVLRYLLTNMDVIALHQAEAGRTLNQTLRYLDKQGGMELSYNYVESQLTSFPPAAKQAWDSQNDGALFRFCALTLQEWLQHTNASQLQTAPAAS